MIDFVPKNLRVGGLRLESHKHQSTADLIAETFIPGRLYIPVDNNADESANILVAPRDKVRAGQTIAKSHPDSFGADSHASSSGTVLEIIDCTLDNQKGPKKCRCIVIETDGEHRSLESTAIQSPRISKPKKDWVTAIKKAGIVGLGGAAFSTARKLNHAGDCTTLIINGAECEPYISCDDMLMRQRAEAIIGGSLIISDLVDADECIIAIERDKPAAISAMREAAQASTDARLRLAEIPSIYPAGGERQLIDLLTGHEVPSGAYPNNIGIVCQNVATAAAVYAAVENNLPLTTRVVTVTGDAVPRPRNIDVLIGTPIDELLRHCDVDLSNVESTLLGGNMMGVSLNSLQQPVSKGANCIIASTSKPPGVSASWPCIRCGECEAACPARLQPQFLHRAAVTEDTDMLWEFGLEDCIECGCCDAICPSHIPLTSQFQQAKKLCQSKAQETQFSQLSQSRYKAHQRRLATYEATERQRQSDLLSKLDDEKARRESIAASVARARKKHQPDNPSK